VKKGFDCENRLVGVLGWLCRQALTMYWLVCVNGLVYVNRPLITALQKRWSVEVNE
jgi:hypothetical protein